MDLVGFIKNLETLFFKDSKYSCYRITGKHSYGMRIVSLHSSDELLSMYNFATNLGIKFEKDIDDLQDDVIQDIKTIKYEYIPLHYIRDDRNKVIFIDYDRKYNSDMEKVKFVRRLINGNRYHIFIIDHEYLFKESFNKESMPDDFLDKFKYVIMIFFEMKSLYELYELEEINYLYAITFSYFFVKYFKDVEKDKFFKINSGFIREKDYFKLVEKFIKKYNEMGEEEYLNALRNGYL